MKGTYFPLYKAVIILISIVWIASCQTHTKSENINTSRLLKTADSLSGLNISDADSLYILLLKDSSSLTIAQYARAALGLIMIYSEKEYLDSSDRLLAKIEPVIPLLDDTFILVKYHLAKGYYLSQQGDFTETQRQYEEGLRLSKLSKNTENQHAFRLNLGQIAYDMGKFEQATKILTEELRFADSTRNLYNQALALSSLAKVSSAANNHQEAINYSKKALLLLEGLGDKHQYASVLMNLGIYYKNYDMLDSALVAYQQAYATMEALGDTPGMIKVRFNIGNIYKNKGKLMEAEAEMKQVLQFCLDNQIISGQVFSMNSLASIYKETGRYSLSVLTMDSALSLAKSNHLITALPNLYENHHKILSESGLFRQAYLSSLESRTLSDSLLSIEKQKGILALNIRYEIEKKESENRQLKVDLAQQKTHFWLLLSVTVLGGFVFLLIVYLILSRQKQLKQLRMLIEERAIRAEQEKKNKEIELEKTMIEKQLKEQELVYQSLVQADLVLVNRSMKENLSRFKDLFSRKKDQDDFQHTLDSLTRDAKRDPLAEFELLFKQLHASFYEKLLLCAPDLTKTELQVCAMLRLNLSSKDIARLINLNVSTIEITRHHIRKKLNLEHSDTLTTFLITL